MKTTIILLKTITLCLILGICSCEKEKFILQPDPKPKPEPKPTPKKGKIKNFYIPGLFVYDTIKNGKTPQEYELRFRADDGRTDLQVFKNTNGYKITEKRAEFVLAHQKGFVTALYDYPSQKTTILTTDKSFKVLKETPIGTSLMYGTTIFRQKLYYTSSHSFKKTGNTYTLDLNNHHHQAYNPMNIQWFLSDGSNHLYYMDFEKRLYRIKDPNNINAGGTLIKDFKIDSSKEKWHRRERLDVFHIDSKEIFWGLKEVIKRAASLMWRKSTYTLHVISKDLKTGKERSLDTKIDAEYAYIYFDKYNNKRYLSIGKLGNTNVTLKEILVRGDQILLGKEHIIKNTRPDRFAIIFTKNGKLFMRNSQKLSQGNSDFTNLKAIGTIGYTAKFIYSDPL